LRTPMGAYTQPGKRYAGEPWQKMGLQQIGVEPGHASRMLGTAFLDKAAERKAIKKDARLRRRKILAVIRTAPTPNSTDQPAYRPGIIMRCRHTAQPRRTAATGDLLPCHPVDEEDDVAGFLVDQRLEDLEHRFR